MAEKVIIVSWITEAMKAHTHNYYHQRCCSETNFPNQKVRRVDAQDIARSATCCGCWKGIHGDGETKV